MKFTGENVLAAPVEQAWDALLDPARACSPTSSSTSRW